LLTTLDGGGGLKSFKADKGAAISSKTMEDNNEHNSLGAGTLYVVSTPIGNLKDITLRALDILTGVDIIAAENVNHSKGLCYHYNISTRLTSYNQHNHRTKGPELIKKIKNGSDIALITSAGTPAISDPGSLLVSLAVEHGIKVSPVPGVSAVIAALSVSGLKMDRFVFLGFLPNRTGKRKNELKKVTQEPRIMVFYESPRRIISMLTDVLEILGDRNVILMRELTKVYEEIRRGPISSVLEVLDRDNIRGEFTVIVEGAEEGVKSHSQNPDIEQEIRDLLQTGKMGVKAIAILLSETHGLAYREIYKKGLALQNETEKKSIVK